MDIFSFSLSISVSFRQQNITQGKTYRFSWFSPKKKKKTKNQKKKKKKNIDLSIYQLYNNKTRLLSVDF